MKKPKIGIESFLKRIQCKKFYTIKLNIIFYIDQFI